MSTGRLTFLYPHLSRTALRSVTIAARWAATTTTTTTMTTKRRNSSFAPRHGKAVEPTWDKSLSGRGPSSPQEEKGEAVAAPDEGEMKEKKTKKKKKKREDSAGVQSDGEADLVDGGTGTAPAEETHCAEAEWTAQASPAGDATTMTTMTGGEAAADGTTEAEQQQRQQDRPSTHDDLDLDEARPRPPPSPSAAAAPQDAVHAPPSLAERAGRHPHMTPPPYVHHFDSYSMVKLLEEGGYTRDQAVSSMKAIRRILGANLDVAQKSLVSKSDVENETYLFRAACSELSTEIKNNRRLQEEQMRQQRTHLQHEVDILTQTLNQELLTLNDSVRGLFNDRRMAVREEQKAMESAIQQINYKMSILLSSDSKSEIEGVRWILIRRSVVGLIFLAVLTLGMIRYATFLAQQRKREAERQKQERERLRRDGGRSDNSAPADAAVILSAS